MIPALFATAEISAPLNPSVRSTSLPRSKSFERGFFFV